jgi:hypothetical protein
MKKIMLLFSTLLIMQLVITNVFAQEKIWSVEKANKWYAEHNWLVGCNFTPSTAINQLEFWQEETFDPKTIDVELGYAEKVGFNSMRVFLHYLVWQQNPEAFYKRLDQYLTIANKHNISTMFVFFDDCWNGFPKLGKQPDPKPGIHNSGWVQCPGKEEVTDTTLYPVLEGYVKGVLSKFKDDKRIIFWDLYNEPGNSSHLNNTIPLLKNVYKWSWDVRPSQPVTAGIWNMDTSFAALNKIQVNYSDIITFHNYDEVEKMQAMIDSLRKFNKPLVCTEYMRRPVSNFKTHLPLLKKENIGAYNWGLVSGKTQTIYPWDSWKKLYDKEPSIWFHDVFRQDGTPFDASETELIRLLSQKK